MPQAKHAKPLSICLVHDDRIGHQKQLKGIANQLIKQTPCTTYWIDVQAVNKLETQTRQFDICIGAGHRTHWPVWRLSKKQRAFSVVLMTPSLPNCLFDAIICPRHDNQKESPRVFITKGPVNTIQQETVNPSLYENSNASPSDRSDERLVKRHDRKSDNRTDPSPKHNLILLGGPSKHFHWSSEQIVAAAKQLIEHESGLPWLLSPSRRTPKETIDIVQAGLAPLQVLNTDCDIDHLIHNAKQVWVSADSSNMIYEALSAAKPTGVIELAAIKKTFKRNRMSNDLHRLFQEGHLMRLSPRCLEKDLETDLETDLKTGTETGTNNLQQAPFNEAERAAKWLLDSYQNWRTKRGEQDV